MVHPFQQTYPGGFNAFLAKLSSDGSSLLYSTYFGGNGSDMPSSVAVDKSGEMILAGYTSSTNLVTANAYQPSALANDGGLYGNYGFLTKFSADGASLVYSTYFGGHSNVALNCGGTPCWPQPIASSPRWPAITVATSLSRGRPIRTTSLQPPAPISHREFDEWEYLDRLCRQVQ